MTLFHLSLVDSNAPKGEQFDVSIGVPLVKILVPAVLEDVLLSSCPACEYEGKGGGQIHCKDHIAKEGGRGKGAETFKISNATVSRGEWGGRPNHQPSDSWQCPRQGKRSPGLSKGLLGG